MSSGVPVFSVSILASVRILKGGLPNTTRVGGAGPTDTLLGNWFTRSVATITRWPGSASCN